MRMRWIRRRSGYWWLEDLTPSIHPWPTWLHDLWHWCNRSKDFKEPEIP